MSIFFCCCTLFRSNSNLPVTFRLIFFSIFLSNCSSCMPTVFHLFFRFNRFCMRWSRMLAASNYPCVRITFGKTGNNAIYRQTYNFTRHSNVVQYPHRQYINPTVYPPLAQRCSNNFFRNHMKNCPQAWNMAIIDTNGHCRCKTIIIKF